MRVHPGLSRPLAGFLPAVALLHFGYPLASHGPLWAVVYTLLYPAVVFMGIRAVRPEGTILLPGTVLSAVFLIFGTWSALRPEDPLARLGLFTAIALFQGYLILELLVFVFRHRYQPGAQLVMAAVCVYLLLGGVFGALFGTVETLWPGSFENSLAPDEPVDWQELRYLSFVTLVTLGYGDIVPVMPWARSLATAEAVAGTLFLATVIARIVGAYVSSPGPGRSTGRG